MTFVAYRVWRSINLFVWDNTVCLLARHWITFAHIKNWYLGAIVFSISKTNFLMSFFYCEVILLLLTNFLIYFDVIWAAIPRYNYIWFGFADFVIVRKPA